MLLTLLQTQHPTLRCLPAGPVASLPGRHSRTLALAPVHPSVGVRSLWELSQNTGTAGFSSPFSDRGLPCLCATPVSRLVTGSHCWPGRPLQSTSRPRGASSPSGSTLLPDQLLRKAPRPPSGPALWVVNNHHHLAVYWGLCAGEDVKDFPAVSSVGPAHPPPAGRFRLPRSAREPGAGCSECRCPDSSRHRGYARPVVPLPASLYLLSPRVCRLSPSTGASAVWEAGPCLVPLSLLQ